MAMKKGDTFLLEFRTLKWEVSVRKSEIWF